jgi:CRISPR-associated protein Csm4
LWTTYIRPRVTVDRQSSTSAAYSSGGLYLANSESIQVSLYALIRWGDDDPALKDKVERAFEALGDTGIGGERSYGYGHFSPEFTTVADDLGASQGEYFTSLSPYLPHSNEREVFDGNSRYKIVLRRGWISLPTYSNLRRPTIRMIDTGAVLHHPTDRVVTGSLADATPDILREQNSLTIYRYGIAWPVPISAAALVNV